MRLHVFCWPRCSSTFPQSLLNSIINLKHLKLSLFFLLNLFFNSWGVRAYYVRNAVTSFLNIVYTCSRVTDLALCVQNYLQLWGNMLRATWLSQNVFHIHAQKETAKRKVRSKVAFIVLQSPVLPWATQSATQRKPFRAWQFDCVCQPLPHTTALRLTKCSYSIIAENAFGWWKELLRCLDFSLPDLSLCDSMCVIHSGKQH